MKPLVCIYCEGTEIKVALLSLGKTGVKLHKILAVRSTNVEGQNPDILDNTKSSFSIEELDSDDGDISFDNLDDEPSGVTDSNISDLEEISAMLDGIKLGSAQFIPIITEPVANYHICEISTDKDKGKIIDEIISDILETKGTTVRKDYVDYIDFSETSKLSVFIEGGIPCANTIDALAEYNDRKYVKIPTIKTAELSLAYYVSKTTKFFPEDFSLIIYTGKEYSKLMFLEGQKIRHIGSTLDIGTQNLQTYDVYFSKILLEMENGGIPRLDNVILCGEDNSENLILSFYGTFPEANVSELKFDAIDSSDLPAEDNENISSFTIPISVAVEYFDEQQKKYKGINILPTYIKEKQKVLQFGWHSYAIMPLLFFVTFFFTFKILSNFREIDNLNSKIVDLTNRQAQNQKIIDMITPLSQKIAGFDKTQAILDSAGSGTEIYWKMLEKESDYLERRRNFWITKLSVPNSEAVNVIGYSLSRSVLTEFADFNNSSLLKSVKYEPLREKNAFKFDLKFFMNSDSVKIR